MNIQRINSAHHFRMQSEREQTLANFPEILTFIIGFSFTVCTKKSEKKERKQVTECLQNLYQSVAIHLKYVLLVLL